MTTTVRTKRRAKSASKPTVRPAELRRVIDDLYSRLNDQMYVAEALQKAARPNGETLVAAYPMLKVIELAAAAHAAAVKEMWSIALRARNYRP
ncbi:hypothetical protein [Bradyrhizobium sp. 6(2017)]|uniref:hypothetical protein n=1 Tax=Bradyrhizobium sp. 6(2017) TaxID=1197460 RepID=UPI0013E1AF14|nr:hypothetical protein [Bradyrhizobium sp. 6(2017)]QIG92876.1 hypothetical protein G6P99_10400 [Bradyrhizobium sp. 6(2017)]